MRQPHKCLVGTGDLRMLDNGGKHGLPPAESSPSQGAWVRAAPLAEGPADSPCVSMGDAASSDTRLFSRVWVPGRNEPLTGV